MEWNLAVAHAAIASRSSTACVVWCVQTHHYSLLCLSLLLVFSHARTRKYWRWSGADIDCSCIGLCTLYSMDRLLKDAHVYIIIRLAVAACWVDWWLLLLYDFLITSCQTVVITWQYVYTTLQGLVKLPSSARQTLRGYIPCTLKTGYFSHFPHITT